MVSSRCSGCECCDSCGCQCESSDDDNGGDPQCGAPFFDGKQRLVGVELEYNNADSNIIRDFCDTWRAGDHYDGSCGREVVTPPMAGKHIDAIMKAMGQALKDAEATCNESCGVHVHVDAADLKWEDMYRLLHVYARIEPILYIMGGQKRVKNTYCAPAGHKYAAALASVDRKGDILAVAYLDKHGEGTETAAQARQHNRSSSKKDGGRYKGLNIVPWLVGRRRNGRKGKAKPVKKDTTVEFRLHEGTLATRRVAEWAHLCERIVSWCAKASDADAKALPRSALRALLVIAPESKDFVMRRVLAWRKALPKTSERRTFPRRVTNVKGKWEFNANVQD